MRARRGGERGLAIILVALTLITMLIFAAFALDYGALYNHRRQDQNAADAAALAAAQDLTEPVATMRDTAMEYAEETVGVDFDSAKWNSCASDAGALTNAVSGANCITYDSQQVRVRIPDQQYQTIFGGVVGADEFRHSAFAVAGLSPEGFGGVLPFGVTGTAAQGGYGCLQSNSNGQASDACGTVSGNFRFLDFSDFGTTEFRPDQDCQNPGSQDDRIRRNIAMGIDHSISIYGTRYNTTEHDHLACEATPQIEGPNAVESRTGNQSADAQIGMFDGVAANFPDNQPARLARHDDDLFDGNAPARVTVLGVQELDNTPLWMFIPPDYGPAASTLANIPRSCQRDQFVDGSNNYTTANLPPAVETYVNSLSTQGDRVIALLQRCFDHYLNRDWTGSPFGTITPPEAPPAPDCTGTCTGAIFALNTTPDDEPDLYDIQYTPRFGYVPELQGFGPGTSDQRILDFHAIYIQRLLLERSGPDLTWDPGVSPAAPTGPSGDYQTLGETTMFVFPDGSLPNGLADENAPFELGVNRFIRLIR